MGIVNATSQEQPDCYDGRLYPMRIPVWYNYAQALVAIPSDERELPAWLWWLIAALVVFLALLAFLVYKYWWKNKATGAALGATQAELDNAVMENEMGFGGDLQGNAVGGDFVRPMVEKPVFRQAYGQQQGGPR